MENLCKHLETCKLGNNQMEIINSNKTAVETIRAAQMVAGNLEPSEDAAIIFHPPEQSLVASLTGAGAITCDMQGDKQQGWTMNNMAMAICGVPGKQTVPRAEIYACVMLMERRGGPFTIHTDCQYVYNGFQLGQAKFSSREGVGI